ncbi:MAG: LysM peptidoglycan-binding domain-containing protein [Heliobacteriaceae bacterium]|jgi:nucleoid-associated protein YgaU|nr:LysM peptidoglycan-binding domain-containing protein [Heliobacteriaceae bacterium]
MKSSTVRRSNLSKEKIAVIEALSRYRHDDDSPNVYVRQSKEQELDMLWQNFKVNQKSDKSPNVYLATGFIAGAVVALILAAIVTFSARSFDDDVVVKVKAKKDIKAENVNFIPSSPAPAAASETYTVKEGDTIEAVLIRFYGSYSLEKQDLIVKANNLANPNALSIGQKLIIPLAQR